MRWTQWAAVVFWILGVGCSRSSEIVTVPKLPRATQERINHHITNESIPSWRDIIGNQVPAAPEKCESFMTSIPPLWSFGTIEVPEDPSDPDGRKVSVFYYGDTTRPGTPVVFYNGGPGGMSHSSFRSLRRQQRKFDPTEVVPFVFIDQRGNGCSSAYPTGERAEILQRAQHYGSRDIVRDSEAIRAKLFPGRKWIAFGQSYGAHIVHRYLLTAPDALVAGFAHANTLNSDPYVRVKNRIASQVYTWELYFREYPNDRARLIAWKNNLPLSLCFTSEDQKEKVCGWDALESLSGFLGFSQSWPQLHELVESIVFSTGEMSLEEMKKFLSAFHFGEGAPIPSRNLSLSVINWVDRNAGSFDRYTCHTVLSDLRREGADVDGAPYLECGWVLQVHPDGAGSAQPPQADLAALPRDLMTVAVFSAQLKKRADLPFYWYSGERDPFVPRTSFEEQHAAIGGLPNVHYTHFMTSGHEGYATEGQVWDELIREVTR